jgi:hypothetical protein
MLNIPEVRKFVRGCLDASPAAVLCTADLSGGAQPISTRRRCVAPRATGGAPLVIWQRRR